MNAVTVGKLGAFRRGWSIGAVEPTPVAPLQTKTISSAVQCDVSCKTIFVSSQQCSIYDDDDDDALVHYRDRT